MEWWEEGSPFFQYSIIQHSSSFDAGELGGTGAEGFVTC